MTDDAAGSPSTARDRAIERIAAIIGPAMGHERTDDAPDCPHDTCTCAGGHPAEPGCDACAGPGWPCDDAMKAAEEVLRALAGEAEPTADPPLPAAATEALSAALFAEYVQHHDAEPVALAERLALAVLNENWRPVRLVPAGGSAPADEPEPEDGNAFFQTAWAEHGRCTCLPGDDIYCEEERCALCTALPSSWPCPTTEHRGYPGASDTTPAGGSAPHQGATTAPSHAELVRAIADPGSFLPRGDNYSEPITSWSARAVRALLGAGETTEETR